MKAWIGSLLFLAIGLLLGTLLFSQSDLATTYSKVFERVIQSLITVGACVLFAITARENKKLKEKIARLEK